MEILTGMFNTFIGLLSNTGLGTNIILIIGMIAIVSAIGQRNRK